MTKRIATAVAVLAASLVLAAPAAMTSASGSSDGSVLDARLRHGCC